MSTGTSDRHDVLTGPVAVIDVGPEEQEWQQQALCAQTDPEAFFPEKGGSTREAKRICSTCDVRAECLEYALAHEERFGIWGGLSERERRRLRRGELTLEDGVRPVPVPQTSHQDGTALCGDPAEVTR